MYIEEYGVAQISINLPTCALPLGGTRRIFGRKYAGTRGKRVRVTVVKLVGLFPAEGHGMAGRYFLAHGSSEAPGVSEKELIRIDHPVQVLDEMGALRTRRNGYRIPASGAVSSGS